MEQHQRDLVSEEQKRRQRWEGVIILAAALGVFLFAFLQNRPPQISDSDSLVSNIVFVLLINLNIILLVLLIFLVGRNLIKLFYERRRKLLGSHLRFRLVLAFVAISLFPAILLFLIGVGFLTRSVENWFAMQIEGALEGSLEVTGAFYDHLADEALLYARDLAAELSRDGLLERRRGRAVQELIAAKRRVLHVDRIAVVSRNGELLAVAAVPDVRGGEESEQDGALFEQVWQNEEVRFIRSLAGREVVCGAVPLLSRGHVVGAVVVEFFVPPNVARRATQLMGAFREYRQLKVLKQPIKNNYLITMSLVTLVVVFSAVWVGLFMAKKITVPLQRLAEGTREVAQGHWAHRIAGEGEDEIGTLVAAFNRMTAELQQSHQELEARRRYMEILLANINAGVVSLDRSGVVTTVNRAAERLLGLVAAAAVARDYREVFAPGEFGEVRRIIRDLLPVHPREAEEGVQESQGQLRLTREGQTYSLLVTGTSLTDDRGEVLGIVCFFEDITQIIRVERMEAWREVACRIAHEIKNPLTPIQLAAQRLHRRFAPQISQHAEVFDECIRSISQEVDTIKKLVNEFSTFARLPAGDHVPEDLNALAQEALVLFAQAHREIAFSFHPDRTLPLLELDREGMKRVLRNLLDNAVAACAAVAPEGPCSIEVVTRYLRPLGIARLEVADTGCGIPAALRERLFEPYFSTKKDGTGLGLAIVATVVADHKGFIRVRDNQPRGSRFVIELPVRRHEQRPVSVVKAAAAPLDGVEDRRERESYG